ncbi:MAG: glycoside hydrolase family 113, partial [Saprospiraceae bacterium]
MVCGLSIVAPPSPFPNDYTVNVTQVNANWVAIIPYAGGPVGKTDILFNMDGQWWGETKEGVKESIRLAHNAGLRVMLKPQIWIPGSWTGALDFQTEKEWQQWEENYTNYISFHADIACEMEVEMICIGTEFTKSETKREAFWRELIRKIRIDYKGQLTYASNWDAYKNVPFWDDLDYIGVDAYFPLDDSKIPSKKRLHKL